MCDMIEIKEESMNINVSSLPLEKHELGGNFTNQATSPALRQQTPQLQATEVTSSGTVSTIPMVSKSNQRLKNSMDIKNYTSKHPIISKFLTANTDSVQNNLLNKHLSNAEGLVRHAFAGPEDIASQKGIFGWTTIDGINLPYLFRFNVKYVAVRMVEMSLLSRYPPEIPSEAKDQPPIISYYITEHEAELLNEINVSHCSYEFGYTPYCQKDLLVKLEDVERFYTTVKLHYYKSDIEVESPDPVQIENIRLLRAKQTIVPYIVRNGAKLVALNSLKKNLFLSGHKNFLEFNLSPWEVKHLNSCYELMKIPCRLSSTSKVVMLDELQLHCDIADLGIVTLGKLNDIQTSLAENSIQSIESPQQHSNNRQDAKNSTAMSTYSHKSSSPVLINHNKNNLINGAKPLPPQRPPPPLIAMPTSHIRKATPVQSCPGLTNNDNSLLVISHVESLAKSPNTIPDRLQDIPRGNNSHLSPINLSNNKEKLRKLIHSNFQNNSSFPPTNHNRERHHEQTESNCSNSFPPTHHYRESPQEHAEANFSNTSPFHQTKHNRERLQECIDSNCSNTSPFSPTNHNRESQRAHTESVVANLSQCPSTNRKERPQEHRESNVSNTSTFLPTNHKQERCREYSESNFQSTSPFHPPNCSRGRLQEKRDLNYLHYSSVRHNGSKNNISREIKTQDYTHSQLDRHLESAGNLVTSDSQSSQRNAERCSCCQIASPAFQRRNDRKDDNNIPVISNIFSLNSEKEQAYISSVITSNDPVHSQKPKHHLNRNDHTSISKNRIPSINHNNQIPSVNHNDHTPSATHSDHISSPNHKDPICSPNDRSEIHLIYKPSSENEEQEYSHDYQEILKHTFLQQLAANKNQETLHKKDSFSDHIESTEDQSDVNSKIAERALWEDHYLDKEDEALIKCDRLFSKFCPKTDSGNTNYQKIIEKITHSPLGALRGGVNFKIQLMLIADQLLPTVNLEQFNLNSNNRAVLLSFVLCTYFPRESFKTLAFLLENILNVNLLRICSGQVLAYRKFFSQLWTKHSWSLTMIRVDDLIKYLPQLRFVFFKDMISAKHKCQDDISKIEEATPIKIKRSRSE